MSYNTTLNQVFIEQWLQKKLTPELVVEEMCIKGFDDDTISAYLQEFKKKRNTKRQFTGFILMAVGAFLGFLSCVITLINPIPTLYNWILYGLTSIAICVIVVGLYFVFED